MLNYYLQNVTSLPDPKENEAALSGIPDWRRDHIMKYLRPCDRKLSLGAWRLLEAALGKRGLSAANVTIGENGKLDCDGVYFNLSHSGDMVLCAISDDPVGCDIEKAANAPMEVAERYFSDSERQYINGAENADEKNRRFFRLWTMKESYLKMTGEGMSLSPERVEIVLDTQIVLRDLVPQPCTLKNMAYEDYEITICMEKA